MTIVLRAPGTTRIFSTLSCRSALSKCDEGDNSAISQEGVKELLGLNQLQPAIPVQFVRLRCRPLKERKSGQLVLKQAELEFPDEGIGFCAEERLEDTACLSHVRNGDRLSIYFCVETPRAKSWPLDMKELRLPVESETLLPHLCAREGAWILIGYGAIFFLDYLILSHPWKGVGSLRGSSGGYIPGLLFCCGQEMLYEVNKAADFTLRVISRPNLWW